MEPYSIPGWTVALAGIVASLVPAVTLYFQRADARNRTCKADGERRRSYERECTRVFDEYVELRQILLMVDGMGAEDTATAKAMLKSALSHAVLPDPARHLYIQDEAPKKP